VACNTTKVRIVVRGMRSKNSFPRRSSNQNKSASVLAAC
jgi:hypothetical protein